MWIKLHVAPDDVWEDAYTESCGLRHKWDFGAGNPNDNTARPDVVAASSVDGTLALCPMLGDEGG